MNKSAREKEAVLNVFASLVRPLTRVAFEYGISASEISGAVRRTYIQSLEERLMGQKRVTTDARIAAVAGLTKSDVSALREATRAGAPHSLRATVSLDQVTNLLTVWHTLTGYSGAYGLALELDLQPTPGSPRKSFRELVAAACPGADTEALLDELVAAGSVEVVDNSTVRCLSRAYLPQGETLSASSAWAAFCPASRPVSFTTSCASDQIHFISNEPSFQTNRCPIRDVTNSQTLLGERGQELLTELDTFLTRLAESDPARTGKKYGVGIYFFEDQAPEGQEANFNEHENVSGQPSKPQIVEIDVLAGINGKK